MIRVRIKDVVRCVDKISSDIFTKQIFIRIDGVTFTARLESREKTNELLNQACEDGFVNFDKENVKWVFQKI